MVVNFSRHPLNEDQRDALQQAGFVTSEGVLAPFFKSAQDLREQTQGKVCSLVAPMGLLLEALAEPGGLEFSWETTLIDWVVDQSARKRGRFAARGMRVFQIRGGCVSLDFSLDISPEWENDYKTNEAFPYGG